MSKSAMTSDHVTEPRWAGLSEVASMAWPIILGFLSWTLMQFVDTVMVARLGADALAAVGSAGLWAFTLSTFFLGTVGCVSTFVSQSLGRGERANCARYAWQSIYLSFAAGLGAVALWPLSAPLFRIMGHSEAVTHLELVYFRVRLLGYVFMAWHTVLAAFFQAVNRPRVPMYIAMAVNVLNVVLDYALIFGKWGFPRWEIAGAAAATVIALAIQVFLLQAVFLGKTMHRAYGTRRAFALDTVKVGEILRIGWPAGAAFILDVANWGIFTSFIVGRFGTTALAANNAAVTLMHLSFMPAVGLKHAIAPIVGKWIGRGHISTATARTYTAVKLAASYMFVTGVIFAVFGRPIISHLFSTDPEVVSMGHILLILAVIFQAFDAISITVSGALRGAGDTRWMLWATVVAAYGVFLPAALILAWPLGWGAIGAWWGATIYSIGLSGVLFGRFRGGRWRHIRIFAADQTQEEDPRH